MLVFIALSQNKFDRERFLLVQVIFYIFYGTCEIKGIFICYEIIKRWKEEGVIRGMNNA
jgi:hypothetical protein